MVDVRPRVMAVAIRRQVAMVEGLRTAAVEGHTVEDRTAVDMGGKASLEFLALA
jgi:hypothetical protein